MHEYLTPSIQTGIGIYYFLVVLLNLGFVAYCYYAKRNMTQVLIWSIVSGVFLVHGLAYLITARSLSSSQARLLKAEHEFSRLQTEGPSEGPLADAEKAVESVREEVKNREHSAWVIPDWARNFVDWLMGPVTYFVISVAVFVVLLKFYKVFAEPIVAWTILNIGLFASGWAITDPNFRLITTKEDNGPSSRPISTPCYLTR